MPFSPRQRICHCLITYSLKPDRKTAMSVWPYCIVRFINFVLKNTKQKVLSHLYCIYYDGEGLVAVIMSVRRQSNNGWHSTDSYGFWRVISFDVRTACFLNFKRNNYGRWSHEKWLFPTGIMSGLRQLNNNWHSTMLYGLWWVITFDVTAACCLNHIKFCRRSHEKWFL